MKNIFKNPPPLLKVRRKKLLMGKGNDFLYTVTPEVLSFLFLRYYYVHNIVIIFAYTPPPEIFIKHLLRKQMFEKLFPLHSKIILVMIINLFHISSCFQSFFSHNFYNLHIYYVLCLSVCLFVCLSVCIQ